MIHFLGIGAQKAGTTWLYEMLRRHPRVLFPAGKEVHFWDQNVAKGADYWLYAFRFFRAGYGLTWNGEITPAYALLAPDIIRQIRDINPKLRMFMSLRNPMARAWSSALMALGRAELDLADASDQWFIDHFHSKGSLARGAYGRCLDNWLSIFPAEQVHVIWFDDIAERPRDVLAGLARHIGIDPAFFATVPDIDLHKPAFEGPRQPPRPTLVPVLREIYCPAIRELGTRFGRNLDAWEGWPADRPAA